MRDIDLLIERWLNGEADEAERNALRDHLERHPADAALIIERAREIADVRRSLGGEPALHRPLPTPVATRPRRPYLSMRTVVATFAAAAATLLVGWLAWLQPRPGGPAAEIPMADSGEQPSVVPRGGPEGRDPAREPDLERITVASGTIEERSADEVFMREGRATVALWPASAANPLAFATPHGSISTANAGYEVQVSAWCTSVMVRRGAVDIRQPWTRAPVTIGTEQGLAWGADGWQRQIVAAWLPDSTPPPGSSLINTSVDAAVGPTGVVLDGRRQRQILRFMEQVPQAWKGTQVRLTIRVESGTVTLTTHRQGDRRRFARWTGGRWSLGGQIGEDIHLATQPGASLQISGWHELSIACRGPDTDASVRIIPEGVLTTATLTSDPDQGAQLPDDTALELEVSGGTCVLGAIWIER